MSGSQQLILGVGAGGAAPTYIEDVFSTWLYTGNDATQAASTGINLSTKGGLVWTKRRNGAANHFLVDTVRGNNKPLSSNSTAAQTVAGVDYITPTTTGYTVENVGNINTTGETYASWTLAKQPKFFDVVTYTGTGDNRTIAHSLGSVPGCIIVKDLSGGNWNVYHRSLSNTEYLRLNTTAAKATASTYWNDTTPTSTVFSIGTNTEVNANGGSYVAYLFAHNAGGFGLTGTDNVISCGSFTASTGTSATVTLGYEPQWILVKAADGTGNWLMYDTMRGWANVGNFPLFANLANAEDTSSAASTNRFPTATGFSYFNGGSASNFIYIAIRRGPMKTPTSGTSVFSANTSSGAEGTQITTNIAADAYFAALRSLTADKLVADRLRGFASTSSGLENRLYTNLSSAETSGSGHSPAAFDVWNTGYKIGASYANTSNVFWSFRRAPSFFDIVCYTGVGGGPQTLTHNLGVAPELVFVKSRTQSADGFVYSATLGLNNAVFLFSTSYGADASTSLSGVWGTSNPTSTTFTVGNYSNLNNAGDTYVAYLFASCPGVSKVGSYTGTGSTLQINCGFTGGARFVLIKRTNASGGWYVWDSARGIVAGNDPYLLLNSTAAEVTSTDWVDTHSPGFELSNAAGNLVNVNGGTYIFLAIA